jgi:hypothetical protein
MKTRSNGKLRDIPAPDTRVGSVIQRTIFFWSREDCCACHFRWACSLTRMIA